MHIPLLAFAAWQIAELDYLTMHVSESENAVEADARKKLCASAYAELSDVVCQYEQRGRTLTLRGCVSSFYLKQLAQEAVRNDDNVHHMDNVIEVADG